MDVQNSTIFLLRLHVSAFQNDMDFLGSKNFGHFKGKCNSFNSYYVEILLILALATNEGTCIRIHTFSLKYSLLAFIAPR